MVTAIYNFALEKAIRQRDAFLREHPEMQSFQDELTRSFEAFGDDPIINMEIIRDTLASNLNKLQKIRMEVQDATS